MINQIAAANEEQSSTSLQIAKNIADISKASAESSKDIVGIASASDQLANLAEELNKMLSQFKIEEIHNEENGSAIVDGNGNSRKRRNGNLKSEHKPINYLPQSVTQD
jgi:cupin superfamily acireductone dioxygenase involved in methionine salvage